MMTEAAKPVWAGFWRRLIAFLVDALVLGALGLAAGALLFEQLAALPGPTRLIGGAVSLLYFGLLSSGVGGSATLGMRLLSLRVRSMRGRPLGVVRSLWRALVLQLPLTFNGLYVTLDEPLYAQVFGVAAVTLVFGVLSAQAVLLLFNAPSRRLVHDLLSGSAVVRRHVEGPLPKTRSAAPAVALLLVLAVFGGALYLAAPFSPLRALQQKTEQKLEPLTEVQRAVQALPGVMAAGVNDNTHTVVADGTTTVTRSLNVTARLNAWPKDEAAQRARVAETVLAAYDLAPDQRLRVELTYGYDIGIASFWRSWAGDHTPTAPTPQAAAEAPAPAEAPEAEPESAPVAAKPARKPKPQPQPAPDMPEAPDEAPGPTVLAAA